MRAPATTDDPTAQSPRPFSRGHLYRILRNPIYVGDIAHEGQAHPGQHPGIIERAQWEAVQRQLSAGRAAGSSHDSGIAAVRLEEAKALLGESRQGFLPRGGTALGHENRGRSEVETPPGQPRRIETYRGAVDASWGIDLFGRVRRSVEAAQAQAGSREALLSGVQAGVAAAVAATWFELRGIGAELAVAADISRSQRESLGQVERFVRAGSASEFDRLRAAASLRHFEVSVPELERRIAASTNALAILLGETPQTFKPPAAMPAHETRTVRTIAVGDPPHSCHGAPIFGRPNEPSLRRPPGLR